MIIPIDKFFAEMELSDEEKKRREDLADDLLVLFLLLFSEIKAERLIGNDIDAEYYKAMTFRNYCDKVEVYIVLVAALLGRKTLSEQMKADIWKRSSDMVETTLKFTDEFYTSEERATLLAENESNFVGNSTDYESAIYQGYRHKQWITMRDERVRMTHALVDGETLEIDEYHKVGAAEMRFPMDMSRNAGEHPEETVLCRCVEVYLR